MAHYDIFREQLAIKYPTFGHALWEPEPRNPNRPVQVGDVGFIREGRFYRLFNALLPADDPSHERGVPEYHEPLVPSLLDHIDRGSRCPNNYCSAGVSVAADPDYHPLGPDDFRQVSFRPLYSKTRGAVLSLPAKTRRENTLAKGEFGRWMVRHIGSWLAFARKLGLGIEEMEEIILVTGCDLTRSWTNIVFLGGQADAQVSFGVKVEGPNINYQLLPELVRGAMIDQGPEGPNLPENQCVFIRGFRVARSFWPLPKHLKAAAGPSPDPGYDRGPDTELVSTPAIPKYRDPLHVLLNYIAEQAPDCDTVLAHDDDLVTIMGIDHDTSLETLEPGVMIDLLRRSNMEIHEGLCGPNADMTVKVATLSETFKKWNIASSFNWLPVASRYPVDDTSESQGATPPVLPGLLPVPTIVQNELGGSHETYKGTYSQDPQVSSPAAVQTQPPVPDAQGLGLSPMPWTVFPHGSRVGQQQPMRHEYTRAFNAGGDVAYANAGPTTLGESRETSNDDWTGTLYLNGTYAHVQARGTEAVGNPNLSAWQKHLQLEPVVDPYFDFMAWIDNTGAPYVPLRCLDEADRPYVDQLVDTIRRDGCYAIVRWDNGGSIRVQLLLAPVGQTLLCAAFPEDGILIQPTHQVVPNPL